MKNKSNQILSLLTITCFIGFLFTDCTCNSKSEEEIRKEELQESIEELGESLGNVGEDISKNVEGSVNDALKGMEKALSGLKKNKDGEVKEPVNFRKLKKFIPESFAGMKRTKHEGSTSGITGFKASVAKGKFQGDDKSLDVEITDFSMGSSIIGAAASWTAFSIDEESDDGYKKTTTIDGHKAIEECKIKRQRCSVSIIVANRFIVTLKGRKIDMDLIKRFIKNMDLDMLARLE